VAWDLQAVTGPGRTGLGVSVQFLLDALRNYAQDTEVVELRPNLSDTALKGVLDRLKWEQWRLPAALRTARHEQDVKLCYSPALGAPISSPVPVVAHVHDLIPLHYPHLFTGAASRFYWCKLLPYTWRRCRALTVSNQSVADDICEMLSYPADRIHVVPYYPDPAVAAAAQVINPGFREIDVNDTPKTPLFVTLATHEWRKNIEAVIKAVAKLKQRGITARLTCIGGHTPLTETYRKLSIGLGISSQVEFPGYLEREQAVRLLLSCTALAFMSHYEGYGMPPQEAQSIGCAVVLSDIPCHRKIYLDESRWPDLAESHRIRPQLIAPQDESALADELERLIEDQEYRAGLRRSGLAYSATFGPADTAGSLRGAFASALATPQAG